MATAENERITMIFQEHYGAVLAFIVRRVENKADAEELVQTTFEFACRRVHQIPLEPETRRWLFQVARRHVSNYWRSRNRRRRLVDRVGAHESIRDISGSEEALSDIGYLIMIAFRKLPETQREVLRLAGWDELSHSEAALILGCSVNAFDIRLHRARAALRKQFELLWEGDDEVASGTGPFI